MKRFLIAALCLTALIGTQSMNAADNYLHIRTSQGWEVLDLNKVDRLYFNNNMMTATDASQNVVSSYPQSDLQKMYVDDTSITGINSIHTSSNGEIPFRFDGAASMIYMKTDGPIEIYNLQGETLVNIPKVAAGESVDIEAIAPGVIVIKSGNYSAKAVKK